MSRIHTRYLLVLATCMLLLGPEESLAADQDWDPISFAGSLGSWAASFVYQGSVDLCINENIGKADAPCKHDCDSCDSTIENNTGSTSAVAKSRKKPHAFELEFGSVEFDDIPRQGSHTDVTYLSAGLRRYWLPRRGKDQIRMFAGLGLGLYEIGSDREVGLNVRIGGNLGLYKKKENWPFLTLELGLVYHKLDSGPDVTDVLAGVRVHLPGREKSKCKP